jgi:hypothetical protein
MRDDYFMNAIDDHESFNSGYLNNISYFVTSTVFHDGHVKDVVETCGGEGDVTQIEYPSKIASMPNFDVKHGTDRSRQEDQSLQVSKDYAAQWKPVLPSDE